MITKRYNTAKSGLKTSTTAPQVSGTVEKLGEDGGRDRD
jgi:hypothetical protein